MYNNSHFIGKTSEIHPGKHIRASAKFSGRKTTQARRKKDETNIVGCMDCIRRRYGRLLQGAALRYAVYLTSTRRAKSPTQTM